MNILIACIWLAGLAQLGIASANFFAWRLFDYRANMERMSPVVREVFVVQNIFIVIIVIAFALICFLFAPTLAQGTDPLARFLSVFLVLFWTLRLIIQLFFYDAETKHRYPLFNILFVATFSYLIIVFGITALGISF